MSQTNRGRNKQHGFRWKSDAPVKPTLLEADLLAMKKAELTDLAGSLGIAVAPKATKAVIVEAILAND